MYKIKGVCVNKMSLFSYHSQSVYFANFWLLAIWNNSTTLSVLLSTVMLQELVTRLKNTKSRFAPIFIYCIAICSYVFDGKNCCYSN